MIKPTIVIADDHPLLLAGLKSFLLNKNYNIVAEAEDGITAYNNIVKYNPDIAILDIKMPKMSGIEIARMCKKNNISTKIIIITLYKEKSLYTEAQKLNISGYIFKEFALSEIEDCIKHIITNGHYFSPKIAEYLKIDVDSDNKIEKLTKSERKILQLISESYTTNEISERLFISSKTVEKHRTNISKKLELNGKTNSLLIWAKENKKLI
ncbi:response regulator [Urechidicola croceus]|uniref:DNA-binding response regulator n=1 Tax=Urechidicola croceus TaxID=1850246 RepID=A0A1D8PA27_9FLAO|nr:response regulator transcription factor [Urechidicola croceus]AOW21437.1 DNA-binding response regulator [Urechidicola croceus]